MGIYRGDKCIAGVGRTPDITIRDSDQHWIIDGEDTGISSIGKDGKTAYEYAVDGGFTGTEEEFGKKMNEEYAPAIVNVTRGKGNILLRNLFKMKNIKILGESMQNNTTGAQLFDITSTNIPKGDPGYGWSINGDTIVCENPKYTTSAKVWPYIFVPVINGTTYYIDAYIKDTNPTENLSIAVYCDACKYIDNGKGYPLAEKVMILSQKSNESIKQYKVENPDIKYLRIRFVNEYLRGGIIEKFMISTSPIAEYESYTNGKPAPEIDNPSEIIDIGKDKQINISINENNPINIKIPKMLRGLKLESNDYNKNISNYTDEDGNLWCADEINFEHKKYIERICRKVLDGSEDYIIDNSEPDDPIPVRLVNFTEIDQPLEVNANMLCNIFKYSNEANISNTCIQTDKSQSPIVFYISSEIMPNRDINEFKDFLKSKYNSDEPVIIEYVKKYKTEDNLSDEELIKYKNLYQKNLTMSISNNLDAVIESEYIVDTQNYIANLHQEIATLKNRVDNLETEKL